MKPNTADMKPPLFDGYQFWCELMARAGIEHTLTCVKRTNAEQLALHAQGRLSLVEVNRLRGLAGMPLLSAKDPNSFEEVTWTMNSKHFADDDGLCCAFDFALLIPGKKIITWDTKWDHDHDGVPEYLEAARLAKAVGLESGAFWKKPDMPHIQLPASVPTTAT